jgi:hypothetical protein
MLASRQMPGRTEQNCGRNMRWGKRREVEGSERKHCRKTALQPGLTPYGIFLWGHLKEHVHSVFITDIEDLVTKIHAAVTTYDVETRAENTTRRSAVCVEVPGSVFESLLLRARGTSS